MVEYKVKVNGQTTEWYNLKGELHREGGLPARDLSNGDKEWYQNDKLHREDGPAIEEGDGHCHWYINNKRHRLDGPAIEWSDDSKEWYIDGEKLTEEEFNIKTQSKREMTMEQLEKELGFSVKIVK